MWFTSLGDTGLQVSKLGLGTVKFGRNQQVKYPQPFSIPDDQTLVKLLSCAQDLQINVLDTAPAYGSSEERLGKILGSQRQDWILVTKTGEEFINGESHFDFSASHTRNSVARSLKRLKTDYLDLVLVHSNGDDIAIINNTAVLETLQQLKQAGDIRAFGMSTKTVAGGKLAVEHSDVVMVTYHTEYTKERCVIELAQQKGKGVLIKKALASGHMDPGVSLATRLNFIQQQPGVNSIIIGTLNPEHLKRNVAALSDITPSIGG